MKTLPSLRTRIAPASIGITVLGMAISAGALLTTGTISKVSVSASGGVISGTALNPKQAPNGRYIVYDTAANDVLTNDTNLSSDIILKNLTTNEVTAVSINEAGDLGDSNSEFASISAVAPDGLFGVAFESDSSNLDSSISDSNEQRDIYVRLPTLNRTFLVSSFTDSQGVRTLSDGQNYDPSIALVESSKKLVVAFGSNATNLRTLDTNDVRDIYLAVVDLPTLQSTTDPSTAITLQALYAEAGLPEPDGPSGAPSISGDGRYVAFSSLASNLVSEATGSAEQVFLYDRQTRALTLVSKSKTGVQGDNTSLAPSISFSGRYITYLTLASNLAGDNPSQLYMVVRYDVTTGDTERVDMLSTGEVANNAAIDCSISPNGRFVTFSTNATNLSSGDTSDIPDVYVRDMNTGDITKISQASDGSEADGHSLRGSIAGSSFNSLSGNITFTSDASNLVSSDTSLQDVFVAPITVPAPFLTGGARIEVPPDVTISGSSRRKTLTLGLQDFDLEIDSDELLSMSNILAAQSGDRIVYDVRLERRGRRRDNQAKLTRRNQVAFRRVRPGSYRTRYRALVKRGTSTVSRSRFSPRRTVNTQ